jgi:hypothetical protein
MNSTKAFKNFLVDLNSKFPELVPSAKLDENNIEIFQKLFISNTMEILKKDSSIFNEPKVIFDIDISEIFKTDPDLIWKHMQPCLFSSLLYGDTKAKITELLPEFLGAFKEELGGQSEIDELLGDDTNRSNIGEIIDSLKKSKTAAILISVFENIDLSQFSESDLKIDKYMNNPVALQENPLIKKIQSEIQICMVNKIKNGEITKEVIMYEFQLLQGKLQELCGDSLNEVMGTQKSDVDAEVLLSNSPEARRARMLARLQRKLKDRKK